MNDNNISANYYLSKSREFMISIFNSDENTFRVYGSEFPVQFYLLQNPDYYYENINSSDGDKTKSFLHFYDTLSCVINIGIFTKITINNIAIETDSKFCHFKPNLDTPIFMFNGLTLMSKQLGTDTFNTFHIPKKGLSILCENNKIENYIFTAKIGGEFLANEEVKDLYLNSEYFREVLANEKLKPLASEILIKKERAIADQNFHYDFIEFKHDKEVLEKKIDSFNINIKAEDFFSDAKEKIRTGTLLWFYDSYKSFSFQWLVINIFYVLLLLGYVAFKIKDFPWNKQALFIFSITFNCWIFYIRPQGMNVFYWYPFIVIIINFLLLFFYKKEK